MKKINLFTIAFTLILTSFLNKPCIAQGTGVTVNGLVAKPYTVNTETFALMKRITIPVTGHDGSTHQYSGVSLFEILTRAEAVPDNQLKGKLMTKYLLITAADNYQVVIAIPEFDPAFTDAVIILADEQDGEKLPANSGPYRLVVPKDKKQARSVMRVTSIEVKDAKPL